MPEPAFRYARRDDARAIVDLIELAYRGPGEAERWDSEYHLLRGPRTNLREVQGLLSDSESRFVVADRGGEIMGCALIQQRGTAAALDRHDHMPAAYFGMFAISPAARTGGLGRRLLAECEVRVQELWRSPGMVMTVINLRDTLIGWYQRRGYRVTGVRMPFPFSETSGETTRDFDLIEMRKDFR
jgi:ribosomal protein S18 acetylase RimI-like enzyme